MFIGFSLWVWVSLMMLNVGFRKCSLVSCCVSVDGRFFFFYLVIRVLQVGCCEFGSMFEVMWMLLNGFWQWLIVLVMFGIVFGCDSSQCMNECCSFQIIFSVLICIDLGILLLSVLICVYNVCVFSVLWLMVYVLVILVMEWLVFFCMCIRKVVFMWLMVWLVMVVVMILCFRW